VNGQSATDSVRRSGGPTASLKPSEASEALKGAETLQRLLRGFSAILSGSTSAPPLRRYVREHAENRRLYPRRFICTRAGCRGGITFEEIAALQAFLW
jgi:hypothetical protein